MKIKNIEYENFRNFKDHGIIKCSTDGKVTINLWEKWGWKNNLTSIISMDNIWSSSV